MPPANPERSLSSVKHQVLSPSSGPNTGDVRKLAAMKFKSREDINQAIALFYDQPELSAIRYRSVGRKTIFVPGSSVDIVSKYLVNQGVSFDVSNVMHGMGLAGK
jgi:hypothetical protein